MARCGYTSDTMCECGQSEQTVQHMLQCQLLDKPCSIQDATETAMMCVNKRKKPIWGKGNRWWTRQEDHLQLIKFWPTCTPGKGVCSGVVCCTLGEGQPDNYEILWLCKLFTMIDDVRVPACVRACVCVWRYFNDVFHYPIIIFCEEELYSDGHIEHIRSLTNSSVFFQRVRFELPSFLTKPVPAEIIGTSHHHTDSTVHTDTAQYTPTQHGDELFHELVNFCTLNCILANILISSFWKVLLLRLCVNLLLMYVH